MAGKESWHMDRIASRRAIPKERKLHPNTVGERMDSSIGGNRTGAYHRSIWIGPGEVSCCSACGYHVCSCPKAELPSPPVIRNRAVQAAERARLSEFEAFIGRPASFDAPWIKLDTQCGLCAHSHQKICVCGRPTGR